MTIYGVAERVGRFAHSLCYEREPLEVEMQTFSFHSFGMSEGNFLYSNQQARSQDFAQGGGGRRLERAPSRAFKGPLLER